MMMIVRFEMNHFFSFETKKNNLNHHQHHHHDDRIKNSSQVNQPKQHMMNDPNVEIETIKTTR